MTTRVDQLCDVMAHYGACLETETARLKEDRFSDIRDNYAQKVHWNEQYTLLVRQLIDSQELKDLMPAEKERVRLATLKLQQQLEENEVLVRAAEKSYDIVMEILLESIRASQAPACVYSVKGEVVNSALHVPLAVSQEL